uniref:Uncharacterized protein n=1 Tax=Quercus lobata TaxID=97700 RepID=A0A7N2MAP1_QUELO
MLFSSRWSLLSKANMLVLSVGNPISRGITALAPIIVAIGLPTLIMGIVEDFTSRGSCPLSHLHFQSIGGISCFIHGLLCISLYLSATFNFGINESSTTSSGREVLP